MRTLRIVALLLFLVGSCVSQDKGGVDQTVAIPVVQKILSGAQLSGSLEYWGVCDVGKPRPGFPELRPVSAHESSALDVLQEVFADDPKMRVIQERDGKNSHGGDGCPERFPRGQNSPSLIPVSLP